MGFNIKNSLFFRLKQIILKYKTINLSFIETVLHLNFSPVGTNLNRLK